MRGNGYVLSKALYNVETVGGYYIIKKKKERAKKNKE